MKNAFLTIRHQYCNLVNAVFIVVSSSTIAACGGSGSLPIDVPSTAAPPIASIPSILTTLPSVQPPGVSLPPKTQPPIATIPPLTGPSTTTPPSTQPPVVTIPPITQPPVITVPPIIQPPVVTIPPIAQPPLTLSVSVNNVPKSLQRIEQLTTRSGTWQIDDLGDVGDAHIYLWRLAQNANFLRVMACRRIFTIEAGDNDTLSSIVIPIKIVSSKETLNWNLGVAQGACRVMQNIEPVAPHAEWIREAIAQKRIPTYDRRRAWRPDLLLSLAPDARRKAYDPNSLGPAVGSTNTPLGSANYVGVTTSQGGEYTSSRGFIHDADASIVDAAVHNEDTSIANIWSEFTQYTFYSLAQPQGGNWSFTNHITIDPQFPQAGDRAWETPIGVHPDASIDSMTEVKDWGRDVAHLENTGFVHWIATEDPIAGIVVQRQAAFAIASFYENYRTNLTTYHGNKDQERGVFNTLSSLWKSRDVSFGIKSLNGKIIWTADRTIKQADEIISSYDEIAQTIFTASGANPIKYQLRLAGAIFNPAIYESYLMKDASKQILMSLSAFMPVQYGKEPLWLWSKADNIKVRKWFEAYTRGLVLRMTIIGGAKGVDGTTSMGGSGFPIGPTTLDNWGYPIAAIPPFNSDTGWAEWTLTLPLQQIDSRATFDGASIHTATQFEGTLMFAKDLNLNVLDLDKAISSVAAAKSATSSLRYLDLQMHKHFGSP